jgi:hypothetical protein
MARGFDSHARHDALLISALAAGDLAGEEQAAATELVHHCTECRTLHDDLLALSSATSLLPAAARRREFTISPQQAARLRPTGWRGAIAAFAAPRMAFTRSLGVGLTTLGLAGLLVTSFGSFSLGLAGAAPAATTIESLGGEGYVGGGDVQSEDLSMAPADGGPDEGQPAPSMAAPAAAASPGAASPAASAGSVAQARPTDRDAATRSNGDEPNEMFAVDDIVQRQDPNYLLIGSVALVLFGLALLVARRVAGRIAAP